jgi:hypothetical protein
LLPQHDRVAERRGSMMLISPTQAEEHLRAVAQQFAQWRQGRGNPRGSRIPESLWAEAIALAEELPPTRVARHLGLKPHALKRRRGGHGIPAGSADPARAAAFIEVTAAEPPATAEVEVSRPDGARLRITYPTTASVLASLLQTFLEAH